jgi:triphosphoribosyl-dephospho-CoA synthase
MNTTTPERWQPGLWAQLACLWEASARKAGNVHPAANFTDLTYMDFLMSAAALAPVMALAAQDKVGGTVLRAVWFTRRVVRTNTNLGMALLLAPLATVGRSEELRTGLQRILESLDLLDARAVYAAIRLAVPGGLGTVDEQDVHAEPTLPLREVMALAQERDLVARQYVNGFREVLDDGVPALQRGLAAGLCLEDAIIATHLEWMARHPDSLIARKRGPAEAEEAGRRAGAVLAAGWPHSDVGRREFAALDAWLRAEGNARNPGTSADLVTACLFVALREEMIELPLALPWSRANP